MTYSLKIISLLLFLAGDVWHHRAFYSVVAAMLGHSFPLRLIVVLLYHTRFTSIRHG
jgi:hypothetical protein